MVRLLVKLTIILSAICVQAQIADLPISLQSVIRFENDTTKIFTYKVSSGNGGVSGTGLVHFSCDGYFDHDVASYAVNDSLLHFKRTANSTSCDTLSHSWIFSADYINENEFHEIRRFFSVGTKRWLFTYARQRSQGDSIKHIRFDCHGINDTISSTLSERQLITRNTLTVQDSSQWLYTAIGKNFLTFKVNSSGIATYGRSYNVGTTDNFIVYTGSVKSSNDGKQVALIRERGNDLLTLYDFDKLTGELKNPKTLLRKADLPSYNFCGTVYQTSVLTGLAFSENDSLLYTVYRYFPNCASNTMLFEVIYQINRYDPAPYLTKKVVKTTVLNKPKTFRRDIFMELGPDGNIYFSEWNDSTIHRISNTNVFNGANAAYNLFQLPTGDRVAYQTSYLPSAYQRASFGAFTGCGKDSVSAVFYGSDDIQRTVYFWGDGDSSVFTLGDLENGTASTHSYASSGIYTIQQKAIYNSCGFTRTKKKTVEYHKPPVSAAFALVLDTACSAVTVTLQDSVLHADSAVVNWGDGTADTILLAGATRLSLAHTYTTQDTFRLSYRLVGKTFAEATRASCSVSLDSAVVVTFHPLAQPHYTWQHPRFGVVDSNAIALCLGDSAVLKQVDSSIAFFILGSDTVALGDSFVVSPNNSDSLFVSAISVDGCTALDTLLVTINALPQLHLLTDTFFCANQLPVSVGGAAYMVKASDSIHQTTLKADNALATAVSADSVFVLFTESGSYSLVLTATSNHGCIDSLIADVRIAENPQLSLADSIEVCLGNVASALITVDSTVNNSVVWYSASDQVLDSGTISLAGGSASFSHLPSVAGTNATTVIATSGLGCKDSASLILTTHPTPSLLFSSDSASFCWGVPIRVDATLSATDDVNVVYALDGLPLDSFTTSNTTVAFNLSSLAVGSYGFNASALNPFGCSTADSLVLDILPLPNFELSADEACFGYPLGVSFKNNTAVPLQVELLTTFALDTAFVLNTTSSFNRFWSVGTHSLQGIALHPNGCSDTLFASTEVYPLPVVDFFYSLTSATNSSALYQFTDNSSNSSSYSFFVDQSLASQGAAGARFNYTFSDTGNYNLLFIAEQQSLCADTLLKTLPVVFNYTLYYPNAITPNNDGLNDFFSIVPVDAIQELNLSIFNRWGELVFNLKNTQDLQLTQNLYPGVYMLTGIVTDILGKKHYISSTLTVVR